MTAAPAGATRDTRRIRDTQSAALAWLSAHRGEFALGEDALDPDCQVNFTWKPLGELAQVCATVRLHTPPTDPLHAQAGDLLRFAWEQTDHGGLFVELQRLEPFATYPLEIYSVFAAAGLRHPGYEAAAATVARSRGWRLTEQEPTRRLGVLRAERRSGIRRPEDAARVLRSTWLGGRAEPWAFERAAGYSLTHVVFHLTDWGHDPQGVPADLAGYLADWLPPWLDTCLDAGMWDLSCELLVVAASLPGGPDAALLTDSWARLAPAQYASGALPEEEPDRGADGGRGPEPDFPHCYHSTLMAAFAAALTLARLPADAAAGAPGATAHRYGGQGVPG
ncbi:hypothetical protein [Streptomyces sp. JB150]|uniref:DUF6895 family protein n=1 Tax=Streptomyces sp. JB150 TaxID=2714844 RepID=UPI00140DDC9E|nr:hypothetical protein [Streptomyces sp. JB150]QIJ65682.1 hypothetical protein G7Z13_29415 [Streptomyces sp. JB150]